MVYTFTNYLMLSTTFSGGWVVVERNTKHFVTFANLRDDPLWARRPPYGGRCDRWGALAVPEPAAGRGGGAGGGRGRGPALPRSHAAGRARAALRRAGAVAGGADRSDSRPEGTRRAQGRAAAGIREGPREAEVGTSRSWGRDLAKLR